MTLKKVFEKLTKKSGEIDKPSDCEIKGTSNMTRCQAAECRLCNKSSGNADFDDNLIRENTTK